MAIIGIEDSGYLGVQFAKALGYRVVAIDDNSVESSTAPDLKQKADLLVNFHDSAAREMIDSWVAENHGLGALIVCTESIPAILWACKLLRQGGIVVETSLVTTLVQFAYYEGVHGKTIKSLLGINGIRLEQMMEVAEEYGIGSVSPAAFSCLGAESPDESAYALEKNGSPSLDQVELASASDPAHSRPRVALDNSF